MYLRAGGAYFRTLRRVCCHPNRRMLGTPGWRVLWANQPELRAWEWETRVNHVTRWPCDDGTYEFDCYSLYQTHSIGLPYVLAGVHNGVAFWH
tara:strand:+ start:222 stop:500 length:279 start_codon:yes stop_codon:yes gene_type:complete